MLKNGHYYLRLANQKDAELLWKWANDPDVRKNSFNPDLITFENHLKWLKRKLRSNATRIWILECNGQPIGQIRYDRKGSEAAEIDFSIEKNHRGRGIGSMLLELTKEKACSALKVNHLKGVVKIKNKGSIKAFVKAGYEQTSNRNSKRLNFLYNYR